MCSVFFDRITINFPSFSINEVLICRPHFKNATVNAWSKANLNVK